MRNRPNKTHSHDKEEKKKHTQSTKIYTVVNIAQGDYRTSHCKNCAHLCRFTLARHWQSS